MPVTYVTRLQLINAQNFNYAVNCMLWCSKHVFWYHLRLCKISWPKDKSYKKYSIQCKTCKNTKNRPKCNKYRNFHICMFQMSWLWLLTLPEIHKHILVLKKLLQRKNGDFKIVIHPNLLRMWQLLRMWHDLKTSTSHLFYT